MSKQNLSLNKKRIYTRTEVPYFDYLATFVDGLRNDFLKAHPDYQDKTKLIDGLELSRPPTEGAALKASYVVSNPNAWNSRWLKYQTIDDGQAYLSEDALALYPTARKIIKNCLGPDCGIALYSVIEPMSAIGRHTDPENKKNKFIRVHIPLLKADGDIFLEVDGEEIDYSDIFGFDNQCVHSAHNYTKDRRLIFLIDIRREFLGLPPAECYSAEAEETAEPFKRNGVIWNANAEIERLKVPKKHRNPA